MVNVILDTNIYGKMLADGADGRELGRKIAEDDRFVIRNFRLIRNELRGAPKTLPLYDSLVVRRVIDETKEIKELAKALTAVTKNVTLALLSWILPLDRVHCPSMSVTHVTPVLLKLRPLPAQSPVTVAPWIGPSGSPPCTETVMSLAQPLLKLAA